MLEHGNMNIKILLYRILAEFGLVTHYHFNKNI